MDATGACVTLTRPLVLSLLRLARSLLPADEARARRCLSALEAAAALGTSGADNGDETRTPASRAIEEAGLAQEACTVSLAVIRMLSTYRVIGPHLSESPEWSKLQEGIQGALKTHVADREYRMRHVGREELRERWIEAHRPQGPERAVG